jgi:hypothetical protein
MQKPFNNQFHNHKSRCKRRGIDFQFSYEDWINWWGDDIALRGRNAGQLVMGRIGDKGPYHPTNVYKTTVQQNVKDRDDSIRIASYKITCEQRKIKENILCL